MVMHKNDKKEGPAAMARGAVTYGGLIYLINMPSSRGRAPLDFEEKEVEMPLEAK
jgi:hypothetical protein